MCVVSVCEIHRSCPRFPGWLAIEALSPLATSVRQRIRDAQQGVHDHASFGHPIDDRCLKFELKRVGAEHDIVVPSFDCLINFARDIRTAFVPA
ncbi:hypothetical protein OG21DRAFT_147582 [Imleria badia]|nr:hypothetical protein OG21DRAFT_147582 [Imleria badia]